MQEPTIFLTICGRLSDFADISKVGGIVLYTAISDHFERTLCTLNCYRPTYRDWVLKKSSYKFDRNTSTLINQGSFYDARPVKGPIFSLLAAIPLFDNVNIPPELTDDQIELYVRVVAEMKRISREKLNSDFRKVPADKLVILRDGHPSALANSFFANLLDQKLPK